MASWFWRFELGRYYLQNSNLHSSIRDWSCWVLRELFCSLSPNTEEKRFRRMSLAIIIPSANIFKNMLTIFFKLQISQKNEIIFSILQRMSVLSFGTTPLMTQSLPCECLTLAYVSGGGRMGFTRGLGCEQVRIHMGRVSCFWWCTVKFGMCMFVISARRSTSNAQPYLNDWFFACVSFWKMVSLKELVHLI